MCWLLADGLKMETWESTDSHVALKSWAQVTEECTFWDGENRRESDLREGVSESDLSILK